MDRYELSDARSARRLRMSALACAAVAFLIYGLVLIAHPGEAAWKPTADEVKSDVGEVAKVCPELIRQRSALLDEQYSSLRRLFAAEAALIGISLFIFLIAKAPAFELRPLGVSIPMRYMRLLLPLGMLFCWMEFGFLFNRLIDNRVSLYVLVEALEKTRLMEGVVDNRHYVVSAQSLARDDFFVDNWFLAFRPQYILVTRTSALATYTGVALFAAFHGLAHACALVLPTSAVFAKHSHRNAVVAYVAALSLALLATHLLFRYGAPQVNFSQHITLGSTVLWVLVLMWARRKIGRFESVASDVETG
ncbi:MAG TPA: hypothetical protein VD971_12505 [Phycisphaerales bacterium]|nr:hypothetical protein [Phycisphaerales bacterium]